MLKMCVIWPKKIVICFSKRMYFMFFLVFVKLHYASEYIVILNFFYKKLQKVREKNNQV